MVKYIIDTHGPDRMTSLLRTINGGTRLGDAIREVYGVSLDELEAQWKAQFAEATPLAPRPDPGTIGTSVLISGAIVLALSLTFVGWVTRRARRREPEDGALTT